MHAEATTGMSARQSDPEWGHALAADGFQRAQPRSPRHRVVRRSGLAVGCGRRGGAVARVGRWRARGLGAAGGARGLRAERWRVWAGASPWRMGPGAKAVARAGWRWRRAIRAKAERRRGGAGGGPRGARPAPTPP